MKKNIAIIMGGYTSECEISLESGHVVFKTLKESANYTPYRIHILKDKWVYVDSQGVEFPIQKQDFSVKTPEGKIQFHAVFNAIHGSPGEDGRMQAYLALLNIPQTSCDMYQAAITYNKRDCLSILKAYGISAAPAYYMNQGDTIDADAIVEVVGLPCFVKANRAGSSLGVSKVYKKHNLNKAINIALKEDNQIIIEANLEGIEVSVGVLRYNGKLKVLPITEIVPENDFFDHEAKYHKKAQEITPARLSETQENNLRQIARKIYELLQLTGFVRSEFIIQNEQPFLLEINTVPGLTTNSILPQQAAAAGISLKNLFENAIEEALRTQSKAVPQLTPSAISR